MGEPASNGQPHANGGGGGGFSLKFAGSSKSRVGKGAASGAKEEDRRELIVGLSDGRLEAANPVPRETADGKKVIPKLANTFEVGHKKVNPNRYIPEPAAVVVKEEDRFESAGPEVAQLDVQYGLQKRERPQQAAGPSVTSREWENDKFKEDMEQLPEQADLDAYQDMPVEEFGEAMLRGMGWTEGRVVGRNPKAKVVEAIEYVSRPAKLGLGARPAEPEVRDRKRIKPGDTREPKKDLVFYDANGMQKHVKGVDDKLVEREKPGPAPGKTMRVVAGTHAGLVCEVLAIEPVVEGRSQRVTVRLQLSQEAVSVRFKELGERWEGTEESKKGKSSKEEKRAHKQRREERGERREEGGGQDERQRDRVAIDPGGNRGDVKKGSGRESNPEPQPKARQKSWLAPHIVVRIVDKKLKGGRLYLKKAEVVDVPAPALCSLLLLDSRESVTDVSQACLETVVPKQEGARVLVLAGAYRGQRARLLQRSTNASAAAVQLTSDLSVVKVSFDDIAEYLGEAGEEE